MTVRMNSRIMRYEVDMAMIKKSVPEADGSHLDDFCNNLEIILNPNDTCCCPGLKCTVTHVTKTFRAINNKHDMVLVAFGWPTEEDWTLAIERTFDVRVLHRSQRSLSLMNSA